MIWQTRTRIIQFVTTFFFYVAVEQCNAFTSNAVPVSSRPCHFSKSKLFSGGIMEHADLQNSTDIVHGSPTSHCKSRRELLQTAFVVTAVVGTATSQVALAQDAKSIEPIPIQKDGPAGKSLQPKNNNTEVKKKVQRNNNMEVKKKVQSNNTEVKKRVTSQKVATKKETTPLKKDDTRTASTLSSSDIQQIIAENAINVTEVRTDKVLKRKTLLTIDKNYEIVQTQDVPSWVPKAVVRPPRVIKVIPNSELLFSSIFAGSITEIIRTSLLYPLGTIRNRIQADRGQSGNMNFGEKAYDIFTSFAVQAQKGDLYAGIIPSLLVTVPASGFYYGARDVTKRMLQSTATTSTPLDDVAIALGAAFVADVVSLAIRTPVDVLATRLQVQGSESNVGNWFKESLERLPALILTDLPFLFTKIALNKAITYSGEDLGRYEIQTILIACFCAFLTTPFDVARTRIVMEIEASNNPFANITELAPVEGVLTTMKRVTKEGDGGVPNLFAGWVQRTLYLGIGRAWFDPIRVIGYLGIRDAVLLEWFK